MIKLSVYACADLHGRYDLYEQICHFLQPEDVVFFLGDAGDRGPDSWKLIKAIYENPQFIYLKGNHEDLFVKAAADIEHYGIYDTNYRVAVRNGGEQTLIDWEKEPNRQNWITRLNNLPLYKRYLSHDGAILHLCHAGFTPVWDNVEDKMIFPSEEDMLWDRKHYKNPLKWDNVNFANSIIIHGHTPIPLLRQDIGDYYVDNVDTLGAYWYCGDHKVDIDNGSCWLGATCLFCLDNFDEHIFTV